MPEIILLILAVFVVPYVLIAVLWTRLSRIERKLEETAAWAATLTDAARHGAERPGDTPQAAPATPLAKAAAPVPVATQTPEPPAPTIAPEPEPEPVPELPVAEAAPMPRFAMPRFDFEDIFGRRLPIWAGGIALAAGGIFLVIYAVEQGLMGPVTRVALSLVFGVALLAAAEAAFRFEDRVRDPRVRQALAGAGIATLYAAAYLAGAQYGLIGPGLAFAGLAAITALALALVARFGLPTGVLGLVGGFATPVMVASEEANVPVLAFYLALLTAGLALTARRLGQRWFGAAGLVGGFAWGGLMLVGGPIESGDLIAIGLYLLALGAAIPLLLGSDERLPFTRLASGAVAAVQMGALVSLAGFGLLTWGLYLLLAAALAMLAWRSTELRPAGLLVTAVGAILLAVWPERSVSDFVMVAAGLALVTLAAPLALLWRGRDGALALAQLCVGALALGAAVWSQFGSSDNNVFLPGLAAGLAALGIAAALAAVIAWFAPEPEEGESLPVAPPVAVTAILAFGALHVVLPDWAEVLGAVAVTLALAALVWRRARDWPLMLLAWLGAGLTAVTLLSTGDIFDELARGFGDAGNPVDLVQALLRWIGAALPFAALALLEWRRRFTRLAEAVLVLIAYAALAQVVPGQALAWMLGFAVTALAWWQRERTGLWAAALALGALWALVPVGQWIVTGWIALVGQPAYVTDLPDWAAALRRILPFALASGYVATQVAQRPVLRPLLAGVAGATMMMVLHVLYRQIFAIVDAESFVTLGLAERTLWQALLIGAGIAAMRLGGRAITANLGLGLALAGLAHFVWFTLALHNPLWAKQAVGALPLANLLAPAYGVAGLAVWWLSRRFPAALRGYLRQAGDAAIMLLIALWSLSALRHGFAGSVLVSQPMTQTEDLLRSFVGIVLALGFLWWGSFSAQRSWRIGSLVLILLAVLKVFLVDAAGLEGLLRVASFVALGASLIGIGWVYSRQLSRRTVIPEGSPTSP